MQRQGLRSGALGCWIVALGACGDSGPGPINIGTLPQGAGLNEDVRLTVGGVERQMWTYLPQGPVAGRPLLIVFHETDGTASGALEASGARALADSQQLAVVAPQARAMASGDWDNHSAGQRYFETYPNTSPSANLDLLLVKTIIQEAQRTLNCDPARVYAIGFSNGAFFAAFVALTLPSQIAAFAERSGGLVACGSTGDCGFAASAGATCDELSRQPGYCSCAGAEKPAPLPTSGRRPAGYLSHAIDDGTVSVYYTCALARRMQELGFPSSVVLNASGGHQWPEGFAATAWPFLSQHTTP
jgi:poly(3-hydroxybutyrate) depolymerase